uniref:tRNA(Ile)-lysidine synthase, chloroplastic n=1 Tax=Hydropuntia rangiferina TaxID=338881 RepID=A0A345U881_9FLOR|nr:tRNAIle-lysidine synthetase [Hydropuntia rangiferina]AXI96667.1 tRNAIle-lysidine synthetase [Hydropuntia rangiferina]UAD87350.1 tRNAIle-lysidine synthetase [Hydropuntia rangiferina]
MKITHLHNKFFKIMLDCKKLTKNLSILIAISGGKDSLCLIKLVEDFNNIHNYFQYIEFIYIDHQWRLDSKQNIKHLINYINKTKNRIYIYQINKIDISESIMRQIRYQIILKHAIRHKKQIIFTAHNQTDQIETFLLNLLRGTGLEGLSSLPLIRKITNYIQIIRPLIKFNKEDISWFCYKLHLPIWSDKTNYCYTNYRNRIRNELLPYLKQYFNPTIEKNIIHFLSLSAIENEYIKQNAIKLYIISRHQYYIAINIKIIKDQHLTLQRRVINIFFYYNFNKYLNQHISYQLIKYLSLRDINKKTLVLEKLVINIDKNWIYIT